MTNETTVRQVCVAFNNVYRKIFGLPKRSIASTMNANHNIWNFETTFEKIDILDSCRGWYRAPIL